MTSKPPNPPLRLLETCGVIIDAKVCCWKRANHSLCSFLISSYLFMATAFLKGMLKVGFWELHKYNHSYRLKLIDFLNVLKSVKNNLCFFSPGRPCSYPACTRATAHQGKSMSKCYSLYLQKSDPPLFYTGISISNNLEFWINFSIMTSVHDSFHCESLLWEKQKEI
jgi:hypothetical protein